MGGLAAHVILLFERQHRLMTGKSMMTHNNISLRRRAKCEALLRARLIDWASCNVLGCHTYFTA